MKGETNNNVAISPDGKYFITGGNSKIVKIWNSKSMKVISNLKF